MTKKDVDLIANAIAAEHAAATTFAEQNAVVKMAQRMASALADADPRFDLARFMDKCLGY